MDPHRLMPLLLELASRLDIEVRYAALGGEGGGLCKLKGKRVLFVDSSADTATQCSRCLSDFAQIPDLDSMFIEPELREALEGHRFTE